LKELEAFFGIELRRRKGNGLVLTEAGRRLAALAREQFAGLDDFKRWCTAQPLELSIAAGNSILE
jgi:DNA-binding transcriptional LysR family regulator